MFYKLVSLLTILLSVAAYAEAPSAQAKTLTIKVDGVRGASGKVMLAIYDKAAEFEKNGVAVAMMAVPADTKTITLSDFPAGKFAISAFHDENNNRDLDLDSGIPVEGYGSSGTSGKWDVPTFANSVFETRTAQVKIHYLN